MVLCHRFFAIRKIHQFSWPLSRKSGLVVLENRESDSWMQIKSQFVSHRVIRNVASTYPGQFCIISYYNYLVSINLHDIGPHFLIINDHLRQWKSNIVVCTKRVTANRVIWIGEWVVGYKLSLMVSLCNYVVTALLSLSLFFQCHQPTDPTVIPLRFLLQFTDQIRGRIFSNSKCCAEFCCPQSINLSLDHD